MSNKTAPSLVDENATRPIALRIGDSLLYSRVIQLSKEQNISVNMAVNMLLGFAFNEAERQGKKFVPKIIFETEDI